MCKTYGKLPDDPFILDMDPVQKAYLQQQWLADQNDLVELAKNLVYLHASFDHGEAVQNIVGNGNNTHVSSDEEYEESLEIVKNGFDMPKLPNLDTGVPRKRRRRSLQ